MSGLVKVIFALVGVSELSAQVVVPGDARRGRELFRTQFCITCHSVNGEGGRTASDLGKDAARSSTPFFIANLMWNHAPTMWAAMEKNEIQKPKLSKDDASDLFAFFWSSRYMDRPGDEARGREIFEAKHCAECHSNVAGRTSIGPPVETWDSLGDPTAIAAQMWNHSVKMRAAMASKGIAWPQLSARDMDHLVAYLKKTPAVKKASTTSTTPSKARGEELFKAKGCSECHNGVAFLTNRAGYRAMSDFAASMWNHGPQLQHQPVPITPMEMRDIVGYLWSIRYFETQGDPKEGKRIYAEKGCGSCHEDPSSGAPKLAQQARSAFAMVGVLWQHGPAMLAKMKERQIAWPRFHGSELADLAAYLGELK